jgi:hypothetical protein
MTDTFGGTSFPVAVPASDEPVGDAALYRLGQCLTAVLNHYVGAAWSAVAPGRAVVERVYYHDPKEWVDESHLPALYIWSDQGRSARVADELVEERRTIQVRWFDDPCSEDHREQRAPILSAIAKCITRALFRERDPAWVAADDTDARAATKGSSLPKLGGFDFCKREPVQGLALQIRLQDGEGTPIPLYGLQTAIEIREWLQLDVTEGGDVGAPYLDADFTVAQDDVDPEDQKVLSSYSTVPD